jgi:hypothetical protein
MSDRTDGIIRNLSNNGWNEAVDLIETLTRRLAEVTTERDEARSDAEYMRDEHRRITDELIATNARATRGLAHAESERDTAYKEASERYKAFVALEAALSRRDEALARIVAHGSAMGPAGTATMLEIARAALALDALTKPQEAADGKPR